MLLQKTPCCAVGRAGRMGGRPNWKLCWNLRLSNAWPEPKISSWHVVFVGFGLLCCMAIFAALWQLCTWHGMAWPLLFPALPHHGRMNQDEDLEPKATKLDPDATKVTYQLRKRVRFEILALKASRVDLAKHVQFAKNNGIDLKKIISTDPLLGELHNIEPVYLKPLAIRATMAHSDHEEGIQFQPWRASLQINRQCALQLGGAYWAYHATKLANLTGITRRGLIPGGGGDRVTSFMLPFGPWDIGQTREAFCRWAQSMFVLWIRDSGNIQMQNHIRWEHRDTDGHTVQPCGCSLGRLGFAYRSVDSSIGEDRKDSRGHEDSERGERCADAQDGDRWGNRRAWGVQKRAHQDQRCTWVRCLRFGTRDWRVERHGIIDGGVLHVKWGEPYLVSRMPRRNSTMHFNLLELPWNHQEDQAAIGWWTNWEECPQSVWSQTRACWNWCHDGTRRTWWSLSRCSGSRWHRIGRGRRPNGTKGIRHAWRLWCEYSRRSRGGSIVFNQVCLRWWINSRECRGGCSELAHQMGLWNFRDGSWTSKIAWSIPQSTRDPGSCHFGQWITDAFNVFIGKFVIRTQIATAIQVIANRKGNIPVREDTHGRWPDCGEDENGELRDPTREEMKRFHEEVHLATKGKNRDHARDDLDDFILAFEGMKTLSKITRYLINTGWTISDIKNELHSSEQSRSPYYSVVEENLSGSLTSTWPGGRIHGQIFNVRASSYEEQCTVHSTHIATRTSALMWTMKGLSSSILWPFCWQWRKTTAEPPLSTFAETIKWSSTKFFLITSVVRSTRRRRRHPLHLNRVYICKRTLSNLFVTKDHGLVDDEMWSCHGRA